MSVDSSEVVKTDGKAQVGLSDFGELVLRLSRLLGGLGAHPAFEKSAFGLTEWLALSLIANGAAKNSRQLARSLDVSRQRVNQIKSSLEGAGLIDAQQSERDARVSLLSLTNLGRTQLDLVDTELQSALTESLRSRHNALVRANKSLKLVMRLLLSDKERDRVRPAKLAEPARRERRPARGGRRK